MSLSDHFEKSGNRLFRWRSYFPLLLIGMTLASLREFEYPDDSPGLDLLWELLSLVVGLVGVAIRVDVVGCAPKRTSGRNTKAQSADGLNTTGLYSIMRHPLYVGNTLMLFSIVLFAESWTLAVMILLTSALYHERIIFAEEAFLERKFGATFRDWAARTPAIWPNFALWKPSSLPFAWRHALQRECLGLFALITCYLVVDIVSDWFYLHEFQMDLFWMNVWLLTGVMFIVVRCLHKRTRFLHVEGR